MYPRLVHADNVRVASLMRACVVALAMMLAVVTPVECAFAGGASRPPYAASVAPAVVFAGRESTVTVSGLNFLPGGTTSCADCNANGATTHRCAFGGARDNGVTSTFANSDPSAYACVVNGVGGATGAPAFGFAGGSWSVNGGYDWAVFGGERASAEDGLVQFIKLPSVDAVVASAAPMGLVTYVSGADFARGTLGCYFTSKNDDGTWVTRAVGTIADVDGMFVSSALYRCESPTYDITAQRAPRLGRLALAVLGDDGSTTTNVATYKENHWLNATTAQVTSSQHTPTGGSAVSIVVAESEGDAMNSGCLIGAIRVSARQATATSVSCITPGRAGESISDVPIMVGARFAEVEVMNVTQSTDAVIYTQSTPAELVSYEMSNEDVMIYGQGGQVMELVYEENFGCVMSTFVNEVTSVFKSTVVNANPFDDVVKCLLPMTVEVGFVALGITGGQYEGVAQIMYVDPPRPLSASPRRSPSEGGGLAWVYGSNLKSGVDPLASCVFAADESKFSSGLVGYKVSSALVACEVPPAETVIAQNGQRSTSIDIVMKRPPITSVDALDSGASIEYAVNVPSATISPTRGSLDGGTPVRLAPEMTWILSQSATGTPDTDDFGTGGCRFQAITVSARVADTGAIECLAPSMGTTPVTVSVAVAVDWRTSSAPLVYFTSSNAPLNFSYSRF